MNSEQTGTADTTSEKHLADPNNAMILFFPAICALIFYAILILPSFLLFERKLEFLLITVLVLILYIEMKRHQNEKDIFPLVDSQNAYLIVFALYLIAWLLLYIILY